MSPWFLDQVRLLGGSADVHFRTNYSGTDDPPPTNVTFIDYSSYYTYSPVILLLSYGIAILFGIIPVILGFMAIADTKLSYSMSFSSTARAVSHALVSTTITSQDAVGQDPLPKHLGYAIIVFEDRWRKEAKAKVDVSAGEYVDVQLHPATSAKLLNDHE